MYYILFYLNQLQENCHIVQKKRNFCINICMRNHHCEFNPPFLDLNSQNRVLRAKHSSIPYTASQYRAIFRIHKTSTK